MNNKRKGNRKELLIKNLYEQAGWIVVKSGASLSPFDLICYLFEDKHFGGQLIQEHVLQIKTGSSQYLKYGCKKEEEEFKRFKDTDIVKFRFVKLHKWERYTIN